MNRALALIVIVTLSALPAAAAPDRGLVEREDTTEAIAGGVAARAAVGCGLAYDVSDDLVVAAQVEAVASAGAPSLTFRGGTFEPGLAVEPQLSVAYRF